MDFPLDLPPTNSSTLEPVEPTARMPTLQPEMGSVGRYHLGKQLGAGGFGQVYLARDEELDRFVAVKIPHPHRIGQASDVDAYLAEARIVARLDHPRIVPVYDFGRTSDGRCFIVSKFVEGCTLAARMREGRLTRGEVAEIVAAVAEALYCAHTQGIVHRDVKPGNILLDSAGSPFLTDFGVALREDSVDVGGRFIGTIHYMSPEQARGEGHRVDGRSDVFSLCIVLYVLLTGCRPFVGRTQQETLEKVAGSDPRPPRQLDDTIPRELERICLKGLAKRVGDRYSTAKELAEDLRSFARSVAGEQGGPEAKRAPPGPPGNGGDTASDSDRLANVVPKGLRAYDDADADFFLQLLPGPRDRQGLPQALSFWKRRIESSAFDETFAVGVMYGPSGCGKTSFVLAGLLPRLTDHIQAVFCEADSTLTETRLLQRLRFACPHLPHHLALKDSLALLRRDPQVSGGKRVLLVLDQFEQWLHGRDVHEQAELVQSLRQCNGNELKCLILVRDDFWLAVSRFLRALEVPLVEGHNSELFDLFDKPHAAKVLRALGRAFGTLSPGKPDRKERGFIEEAIAGLAENNRVVCVRLALFAEMMKSQPWTIAALRSAGGVAGTGLQFLQGAFAAPTAPAEHRLHQRAARRVLESLLPEGSTDIKGRLRSYSELQHISGYASRPDDFQRLVQILDRDLRLITPTDAAEQEVAEVKAEGGSDRRNFYQLTHDYLVPSLREWLREERARTLRGRAELCLAERTRRWRDNPETRQLPTCWEWLRIRTFTRSSDWTEAQRSLMLAGGRRYLWRAITVLTLGGLVAFGGREVSGRYHASANVRGLLAAQTADIEASVDQVSPYHRWAESSLRVALRDPSRDKQLRASLALLPREPQQREFLLTCLLDAKPDECEVLRDCLQPYSSDLAGPLWARVGDSALDTPARFRAACVLAGWMPNDERWKQYGEDVATWLVAEESLFLGQWLEMLKPTANWLTQPLNTLYQQSDQLATRYRALVALADYWADDLEKLLDLSRTAQGSELPVLARSLKTHPAAATALRAGLLREVAPDAAETAKDSAAKARANNGLLLCLIGSPDSVWRHLTQTEDQRLRTCLVHGFAAAGVDAAQLAAQLNVETDVSARRAILWSLGKYDPRVVTRRRCETLAPVLEDMYRADADPGLRSAAEWLLRTWGSTDGLASADEERALQKPVFGRGWYVTSQGHTMAVITRPGAFRIGAAESDAYRSSDEPLHEVSIEYDFAVATKEVSLRQYSLFRPASLDEADRQRSLDSPAGRVSLAEAMGYCRWLTEQEGLSENDMCYEVQSDGSLQVHREWLTRTGYRLPTEAEWEFACRAGSTTRRNYGHNDEFLGSYGWYLATSDGQARPCGLLLPNDFGLFDMYGNVAEWCQNRFSATPTPEYESRAEEGMHVCRGGSHGTSPGNLRSAARIGVHRTAHFASFGFRIVRTMPTRPGEQPATDTSDLKQPTRPVRQ